MCYLNLHQPVLFCSLFLVFTAPVLGALKLQEPKHGVIGFGIPMYEPVCCYACHDALSGLYLNCTTFSSDHSGMEGMDMKLKKRMDMGGNTMAETSDECRARDQTWLQTLSYCINSHCTDEGVSEGQQARCFQKVAAELLPVQSLQQSLPQRPPTVELADDDEWLNTTSLVNEGLYAANRRTLDEFAKSEERHTRYSLIVWLVMIGTILAVGAYTFFTTATGSKRASTLSRKLNQHLFLPALFGSRQLEPLPYNIGYAPSRILSLFIFIYVFLNVIFCCVSYHKKTPNTWFAEDREQMAAYVSNRTGVLSFANLGLAIVFSGRNNLLITLTGWSQTTFLAIHRWVSRVATVQAIVHSIIYTLTYFWSGGAQAYYAEAAMAYYWWGIIATTAMGVAVGVSVLPIRLRAYEFFLITHIILAILAIAGCWYHVDLRFKKRWGYEVWVYLAMAFWGFDRLVRFARVAWYNEWTSVTPSLIEKIPDSDFIQLTVFPGNRWVSSIGPGKHSFLAFPGKFWESHPFTIADWGFSNPATYQSLASTRSAISGNSSSNVSVSGDATEKTLGSAIKETHSESERSDTEDKLFIRFLLRPHTGSTRSLFRKLITSPPPSVHQLRILTEGPYAGHSQTLNPLRHADTVLCIVGGIGVTFAQGFLKQYIAQQTGSSGEKDSKANSLMANTTKFVLAWSAREEGLIRHVTEQMIPRGTTRDANVEVRVWHTRNESMAGATAEGQQYAERETEKTEEIVASASSPSPFSLDPPRTNITSLTTGSRMPIPSVLESVLEPSRRVAVLVCAPGSMADDVRKSIVQAVGNGFDVQLIEEAFAW